MATVGSIQITITPQSGVVDQGMTVNGTVFDTTGAGLSGVSGTYYIDYSNTGTPFTSGPGGTFSTLVSFNPAAQYTFYAEADSIISNTLTVDISPAPSPSPSPTPSPTTSPSSSSPSPSFSPSPSPFSPSPSPFSPSPSPSQSPSSQSPSPSIPPEDFSAYIVLGVVAVVAVIAGLAAVYS